MLKQSFRMKKVLAILVAVLFVVSLTAVAVDGFKHFGGGGHHHGGFHHGGFGHGHGGWSYGGYGDWGWGYPGWGYGAGCYYMGDVLVCPAYGYGGYLI